MTTILAHIEIQTGQEETFENIMADMVEHTLNEEKGVLRYEYYKGQQENFYYCLLSFTDKWAFYLHQNSDYHEGHDFGSVIKSIQLEYLDPVSNANPLNPTIDEPISEDADEPMHRAQKLYPIDIADWWQNRK
jgi:quinol monooxygenase YgiN